MFQVGDTTYPGRPIVRQPDLSTLLVSAELYDVDDGRVEPGQPATISLDAFPDALLQGRVRDVEQTAQSPSRRSSRRTFRVLVEVEGLETDHMLPGMSSQVIVENRIATDAALVPRSAIAWDKDPIRLVLADGREVEVEIGPCNNTYCVLVSGPDIGTELAIATGGLL